MDATKKITKALGGNRLGSGDKMNIDLHAYNRSTHDLSFAWRSSMNVGTLVPWMKQLCLNGESWPIDLQALVRTVPTTGPIYGSYKLQLDMFVCPIRLYNGLLHNNMTKIGMKMGQVKFPKFTIKSKVKNPWFADFEFTNTQINPSSLVKYLGISGIGDILSTGTDASHMEEIERKFNAVPIMAYYDIYKNYYANKQEEKGVIIANGNYTEVQRASHISWGDLVGGIQQNFGRMQFREASTPPVTIPATLAGYQQLETPVLLSGTALYEMQRPNIWDNNFKIVVQKIEHQATSTVTTYTVENINTVFPNVVYQSDSIQFGNIDAAYIASATTEYYFYAINYNEVTRNIDGIGLKVFDLENIDNARIAVLRDTGLNHELSLNNLDYYPYKAVYEQNADKVTQNINAQQGLAIKTYQSDLLQNWLQTEWIDGTNGINQITAIDVSSGSFTIDALNLANKVYNMLNRIAVSGGSYEDWQEAVYSTEAVRRAEQPIYVGGMSCEIVFEEVVATTTAETETTKQALGQLGGKGSITNVRGGNLEVRIDEPSYLIGIASITPRIDYSQGNDWDMTELDTMDDVHKPALDGIGFEDLLQERAAWWGTYYDKENAEWVKLAMGKTPAWINYMTTINKCYGDFAEYEKTMYMTLNRNYENDLHTYQNLNRTMGISDLTTYIDPTKYNYGFADSTLTAQNFWVQIGVKTEPRRVMSAKQIPNL